MIEFLKYVIRKTCMYPLCEKSRVSESLFNSVSYTRDFSHNQLIDHIDNVL